MGLKPRVVWRRIPGDDGMGGEAPPAVIAHGDRDWPGTRLIFFSVFGSEITHHHPGADRTDSHRGKKCGLILIGGDSYGAGPGRPPILAANVVWPLNPIFKIFSFFKKLSKHDVEVIVAINRHRIMIVEDIWITWIRNRKLNRGVEGVPRRVGRYHEEAFWTIPIGEDMDIVLAIHLHRREFISSVSISQEDGRQVGPVVERQGQLHNGGDKAEGILRVRHP